MKQRLSTYLHENELKVLLRLPDQRTLIGKRDYAILKLMLLAGLRRDEICNLTASNLQVNGKEVDLYVVGKGDKERKLPLTDSDLISSILSYWKHAGIAPNSFDPFFKTHGHGTRKSGNKITWRVIQTTIDKYISMLKLPRKITPHSFRHTYLTRLIQKGADLETVRKLAGHSSIATTQTYLHTDEDRMRKAVETLTIGE
jgi:Site-specific recombinase XerD